MRMRSAVVIALGVLALGAVVALVSPGPRPPEPPAPTARAPSRTLPGPSVPSPPPRGTLSLRGRVVDARRAPVSGVKVSATRALPGESLSQLPCDEASPQVTLSSPECLGAAREVLLELIEVERGGAPVLAHTTTAADGTFQLDALPEGTVALWALGAGGSALKPDVRTGTEGVELVLEDGMSLEGRVVDEAGTPLAGAKVTLFEHEGSRYFERRTDADGRFALGPLPDVAYGLVASSPGLMPLYLPEVLPAELEEDLVLPAPRRLIGQVLAAGRPVAGAQVHVEDTSHVTTTDAEGRFAIEPLSPGGYLVRGEHAGQHALAQVSLEENLEVKTTLRLGALFFIEGTVHDEAGAPVAGATIAGMHRGMVLSLPAVTTSADGRFRMGALPAGPALLTVQSEQYLDTFREEYLTPSTPPLTFTLTRAVIVEGLVTDSEGRPLKDADVRASRQPKPRDPVTASDVEPDSEVDLDLADSDAEGRFRLKLPAPGRHFLTVSTPLHIPLTLEVDAPATGVHFRLREGATLQGTVVDARGEPLADVDLRIGHGTGSPGPGLDAVSDDAGSFELAGLAPGTYALEASLKVGGAEHQASLTVEVPGPGTVQVTLRMDTGQSVSGIVVDEQGRPIPDAEVEAYAFFREAEEYPGGAPATATTGPDGRFTVHHLVEGACLLSALKVGYLPDVPAENARTDSRVPARTGARDVRLVLRYQGSLSGRVVRADGTPVTHFRVRGTPVKSADGAFRVPVEQAGRLHLRIEAPDFAAHLREVDVAPGEDVDLGEVRLEKGRRIHGLLVNAETSEPLQGALLRLRLADMPSDPRKPPVLSVATAFDGTFSFEEADSRPLVLEVEHNGYRPLRQPVGAGDQLLELRLSRGARVDVTVVDREGQPMKDAQAGPDTP